MYTVLESIVSHSLGRRMSASEHSYHSGRSKGELYLRGQVLQRGVGERCSTEPQDKISLVSLLLSCTYFKHYFHLLLNVKCLLVKSYRVLIFIHYLASVFVLHSLSFLCSSISRSLY